MDSFTSALERRSAHQHHSPKRLCRRQDGMCVTDSGVQRHNDMQQNGEAHPPAENVGILAAEAYFPSNYVSPACRVRLMARTSRPVAWLPTVAGATLQASQKTSSAGFQGPESLALSSP